MSEYLKMADVFVVDGDADFAVLLPMSVKPEYDDCVTPHDYATHAINTHDELVEMNRELLAVIVAMVDRADEVAKKIPSSEWVDGYRQCIIDTRSVLLPIAEKHKQN